MLSGIPSRTTYIGITNAEMVFAIARDPHKPAQLQRAPLANVSVAKFKESHTPLLTDVLVIDTGTKRLWLSTGDAVRPVIRELAVALSKGETTRVPHPQERTRTPRSQWAPILAGIMGANLGYVIVVGAFLLITSLQYPTGTDPFLTETAINTYMCCAFPTYLPLGAISGLRAYRFAQRKDEKLDHTK